MLSDDVTRTLQTNIADPSDAVKLSERHRGLIGQHAPQEHEQVTVIKPRQCVNCVQVHTSICCRSPTAFSVRPEPSWDRSGCWSIGAPCGELLWAVS